MPYIDPEWRTDLDPKIAELLSAIEALTEFSPRVLPGVLNYVITKLILGAYKYETYERVAIATGVLENVKQEFYRRVAEPYEDKMCDKNGDVY